VISTVMYFSVCVWLKEEEEEETQVLLHSFRQKTHFVFFFGMITGLRWLAFFLI